ncbi:cobalt-precorrin-6A reductase [Labrenzia sp. PHM005]|uniref:cobalt-precorrin-6A reductase n=1 Tax=Labrenzia sp. PHM005 TaxID=2590016 RepID=UPI00113FC744|nr:cobalt-precorrin-6A reductase [Labrenzia sp. PHM005]QDG74570.1 cobalt-precorrin-6A reductase [Labrenzia sp. PHM005]
MTTDNPHILLLAGTHEARLLAKQLPERFPGVRLTASFAGVVKDLQELDIAKRVGGFGGTEGLKAFVKAENVTVIVDATHPFAAQISRNAVSAATGLGIPVIRLERPAWCAGPGDQWQTVSTIEEAAKALPAGARAFLAVGRKEVSAFYHRTDIFGLARMIEPPENPLPHGWSLLLSRPPQDTDEEVALFKHHNISHVVTKNSGGTRAFAKIKAARRLQLPVIIIERPKLPDTETAADVPETLDRLANFVDN